MASIKERFVIAHLRHIAGRQHRWFINGKEVIYMESNFRQDLFPPPPPQEACGGGSIWYNSVAGTDRPQCRRQAPENLEKGLSKVNCSAMDGSNC